MVVGLSYSHTVLSISLIELERHVQDYKKALLYDFNEDAILSKVLFQVVAQSDKIRSPHIEAIKDNWLNIGAIHLDEVDRIEKRVARLFEILSPSKTTSTDDRTVFNFKEPYDPNSEVEWVNTSDRLQKKQTQLRNGKRQKRALPLLMAGAALMFGGAGTLFGWLGIRGSQRVGHQLEAIEATQGSMYRIAAEQNRITGEVLKSVAQILVENALKDKFDTGVLTARLRAHVAGVESRVAQYENLIQELQGQKLAVDFLDVTTLNLLFNHARKRAMNMGFLFLLQHPSDLFQVKASHFFNGEVLTVILHLPIAPEDSYMRLFKLHPFPLPFSNETFIIPNVRNDILGVSNSNFRYTIQMENAELDKCRKINKLYLCERTGLLHKYPEDNCLGSLYHQKFELAKRICPFLMEPAREFILQLMDNWFLIYMMEPATVPILCANSTPGEWHVKAGITRHHLSAGCVADFPRHRLLSDVSVIVPQDYVQFEMDWDPIAFMPELRDLVIPEFQKLERLGTTSVDLSTLQSLATAQLITPPFLHKIHFGFNTIAALTATALATLAVYRCYLVRAERQRRLKEQFLQEAVQATIQATRNSNQFDDGYPRSFVHTPGPGSKVSANDSASNVYPRPPTAP
jgi:hypothetical protein